MREETSVEVVEAISVEVLLVAPTPAVAPVVLVEPAPAAPVVPVVSVVDCCCCEVVSVATVLLVELGRDVVSVEVLVLLVDGC